jgi:hypothetical protein
MGKIKATIALLLLITTTTLFSQTFIQEGEVNGEWIKENSPYYIEGDIYIGPDQRLAIDPGVKVIFNGAFNFDIAGRLEAVGTPTDSISFTLQDTTGFHFGEMQGWSGLYFIGYSSNSTENSLLSYCNIEFSAYAGINCEFYSNLLVSHSQIRYNANSGISVYEYSNISAENIAIYGNQGMGFKSIYSAPVVNYFSITDNHETGLYIIGSSNAGTHPVFSNGLIENNISASDGGGVRVLMDANPELNHVIIRNNSAVSGGGYYSYMAYGSLHRVSIENNKAVNGGGIYLSMISQLQMDHSQVIYNMSQQHGGAVYILESGAALTHCTIARNVSGESAGGLYYNNFYNYNNTIRNSIIWDNQPGEFVTVAEKPVVSFSNIKGGFAGGTNIKEDPLFADPEHHDFHLTWVGFPYDFDQKSPCIDAGDPSSEKDPDGTNADMGAFYFEQDYITISDKNYQPDGMFVYPNPVADKLNIHGVDGVRKAEIRNLSGALVWEKEGTSKINMDVSQLTTGIYLLMVYQMNDEVKIQKIIKK